MELDFRFLLFMSQNRNHSSGKWQAGSTFRYHKDHNCTKPTYLEAVPRMLTPE